MIVSFTTIVEGRLCTVRAGVTAEPVLYEVRDLAGQNLVMDLGDDAAEKLCREALEYARQRDGAAMKKESLVGDAIRRKLAREARGGADAALPPVAPCHFCGGKALFFSDIRCVECPKCGASGPCNMYDADGRKFYYSDEEAILAWNRWKRKGN